MDFDYKILEEKFKQAPENVQLVLTSSKVTDDIQMIAANNGLLIDQASTLFDLVSYVLLGLISSKDFVKTLSKEAGIDEKISRKVVQDINDTILADIRTSMRNGSSNQDIEELTKTQEGTFANKMEDHDSAATTSLEVAGNFSIEKEPTTNSEPTPANITPANKAQILNDIEFPMSVKGNMGSTEAGPSYTDNHTEPLVDQLLSMPTNIVEQKVVVSAPGPVKPVSKLPEAPTNLPVSPEPPKKLPDLPPKPRGPDLYRESIK